MNVGVNGVVPIDSLALRPIDNQKSSIDVLFSVLLLGTLNLYRYKRQALPYRLFTFVPYLRTAGISTWKPHLPKSFNTSTAKSNI
jgi:hypothetical protein